MKSHFTLARYFYFIGVIISLVTSMPTLAATVSLATAPLATSTTTAVKPNILLVVDNSGSMARQYMPDEAGNFAGKYGFKSSQCNGVYYDPTITYVPPLDASKTSFANSNFSAALDDGFDSGSATTDLNSIATYYKYTGTVTDKDYFNTSSTFYTECNVSTSSASSVFSKRRLASTETTTITVSGPTGGTGTRVDSITVNGVTITSGATTNENTPSNLATKIAAKITLSGYSATASGSTVTITGLTSAANYTPVINSTVVGGGPLTFATDIFPETNAAKLTNFANWYSYYRSRMLMMKTSSGIAFSELNNSYRVGLMQISPSNAPLVEMGTFETTKRADWYSQLYAIDSTSNTPLREALSNAGRYYAGKLSSVTDPMQYSCQQNFTILSTDGYWNGNQGFKVDGSTAVGNQDTAEPRPLYDGGSSTTNWTFTYTRNFYSKKTSGCSSGKKLQTQPEIGSCTLPTSTGTCTPTSWSNNGTATVSGVCNNTAAPSPSTPVQLGASVETPVSTGGTSDSLADVAEYYYVTDLRTPALSNCTGVPVSPATTGNTLCSTPAVATDPDPYNNVFQSATDNQKQQHMTTFTLGLGASGRMKYSSTYLDDATGDFVSVKLGSTATSTVCDWQTAGTVCNWPIPGDNNVENIDDLWHAAVNGRGAYFSATNPESLASGLASALAGINAKRGAAAAAATSTQNPVPGNNFSFFASYTTVEWKGNLEARGIDTDTGVTSKNATWCVEDITAGTCATALVPQLTGDTTIYNCETPSAVICAGGVIGFSGNSTSGPLVCKVPKPTQCTGTMNTKVGSTSDTRVIKTANAAGTSLIDFDGAYATANPTYFDGAKLAGLSQWSTLDSTQKSSAVGANLVNYLRGQTGYEDRSSNVTVAGSVTTDNRLYRYRTAVMGDALESKPAFIGKPVFSYPYAGYSEYKTAKAGRAGAVYLGTNDGMLHAFNSATGVESWAYVPSMVIPNMWKLADFDYSTSHRNFVNGNPTISDICTANCNNTSFASTATTTDDPVWKTILVGGLGGGGRGYYALDITTPSTPILLWEFTTTAGIGKTKDDDLGYSYGQPVVTKKDDGTWVVMVTSGYNNVSPGDGKGYLYVLNAGTGSMISKISTGVGDTTTPSGLAKIAGWNNDSPGNLIGYVYGGDLLGNVWRFDINGTTSAVVGTGDVLKFATLFSDVAGTSPQAITTTPVLAKVSGYRVVYIGTGKYLEISDLTTTQKQTQYAIKDDNSGTLVNPRTSLVQQTMTINVATGERSIASASPVNFYTGRGWFIDFSATSGERVNIDSQLVQGALLVPTIVPSNTACSPGGFSYFNVFNYKTGGSNSSTGIVSRKYDDVIVGFTVIYIDGKPVVSGVTSGGETVNLGGDFESSAGSFTGKRTLWRELIQ